MKNVDLGTIMQVVVGQQKSMDSVVSVSVSVSLSCTCCRRSGMQLDNLLVNFLQAARDQMYYTVPSVKAGQEECDLLFGIITLA